jgi:hypothetical protein
MKKYFAAVLLLISVSAFSQKALIPKHKHYFSVLIFNFGITDNHTGQITFARYQFEPVKFFYAKTSYNFYTYSYNSRNRELFPGFLNGFFSDEEGFLTFQQVDLLFGTRLEKRGFQLQMAAGPSLNWVNESVNEYIISSGGLFSYSVTRWDKVNYQEIAFKVETKGIIPLAFRDNKKERLNLFIGYENTFLQSRSCGNTFFGFLFSW